MFFSTISQIVDAINQATCSHVAGEIYIRVRPEFKADPLFFEVTQAMNARWLDDYEAKNAPANFVITKVEGRRRNRGAGRFSAWVPTVYWKLNLEGIDWRDLGDDHLRVKHALVHSYQRRKDAVRAIEILRKRGADQLTEVLATRVEVA